MVKFIKYTFGNVKGIIQEISGLENKVNFGYHIHRLQIFITSSMGF